MKRKLLAMAVPALLIASTANASVEVWNKDGNKVDLYGRVYALNYLTDRDNQTGEGDKTTARFGMSGQTQVTDWLTGYGRWEYEAKTGENAKNETRYAFAGLNFGDFGSFDYGRNDGVLKTLTSYTDVLPEFGGDASNNDLYALTGRTKAVATYRNSNMFGLVDGLRFAVQYADNGDNSSTQNFERKRNHTYESAEAWGSAVDWTIFDTGFSVGAGYAQTGGKKDAKAWTSGIKYDNNNTYLAALYIEGKQKYGWDNATPRHNADDLKTKGFELVAQYGIDLDVGRITPSIAYIQHKVKDAAHFSSGDAGLKGDDLAKYVDIGMTYDFNKNLQAVVDYKINLLDKDDFGARRAIYDGRPFNQNQNKGTTKDTVALGLIYQF